MYIHTYIVQVFFFPLSCVTVTVCVCVLFLVMRTAWDSEDNVRVFCRFRPKNAAERQLPLCVAFDGPRHVFSKTVQTPRGAAQQPSSSSGSLNDSCPSVNTSGCIADHYRYSFSRVYEPDTTQGQLYDEVARPIVDDVMQGYNGTLLVYGQTGSGKTHTMFGSHSTSPENSASSGFHMHDDNAGIVPRAVQQLFHTIHVAEESVEFEIRAQFIEVYMERIRDLLNSTGGSLHLREDSSGFYVENCETPYVANTEELLQLVSSGLRRRVTAVTASNDASSRSHSVLNITVKRVNRTKHEAIMGKLFLVDLAGCEKVSKTLADGLQLAEAKLINKSLTTLGHVIMCLAEKQAHVPYRDSKLTQILKESLGGNSRTALIVCCSPSQLNGHETLSSLRFGARAQNVCNRAVVNRQFTMEELKSMLDLAKIEIQRLQRQLQNKQTDTVLPNADSHLDCADMTVRDASVTCKETVDDDSVEKRLQNGAREQLSLGDMRAEVDRLRDALRDAEYRADLLHTDSSAQASLVQNLQQECAAWEEAFVKVSRELGAHRRCAQHCRVLLQEVRNEVELVPRQLSSYVETLRGIRELIKQPSSPPCCRPCGPTTAGFAVNGQSSPTEPRSDTSSHRDVTSSKHGDSFLLGSCRDSRGAENNNNGEWRVSDGDRCGCDEGPKCDVCADRLAAAMNEVEELRRTNGALALELQLAHKKLSMRHTRIESLKCGFRKESAEKKELKWKLEEERTIYRVEIQKARSDVLHWRQCYDDLLNNCHTVSRKSHAGRSHAERSPTPTLGAALSSIERRLLPGSSTTAGRGIIVKAIRGGGNAEPRGDKEMTGRQS